MIPKTRLCILSTFSYLKQVERSENGTDMSGYIGLNNSRCKRVLNVLEPINLNVYKVVIEGIKENVQFPRKTEQEDKLLVDCSKWLRPKLQSLWRR